MLLSEGMGIRMIFLSIHFLPITGHNKKKLNEENGWINCYNGDQEDSGIFRSLQYDVMSDTIVETSMADYREQFSKNDEYEYQLPGSIDDVVH